jgi:hypothetical protein
MHVYMFACERVHIHIYIFIHVCVYVCVYEWYEKKYGTTLFRNKTKEMGDMARYACVYVCV